MANRSELIGLDSLNIESKTWSRSLIKLFALRENLAVKVFKQSTLQDKNFRFIMATKCTTSS